MAKKNVNVKEEEKKVIDIAEELEDEVLEGDVEETEEEEEDEEVKKPKKKSKKKESWIKRTFTKENAKKAGSTMLKVGTGFAIGVGTAIAVGMKMSKPSEEEVKQLEKFDDYCQAANPESEAENDVDVQEF